MSNRSRAVVLDSSNFVHIMDALQLYAKTNPNIPGIEQTCDHVWNQYRADAAFDGNEPIPAFRQGIEAKQDGLARNSNPHPPGSYRSARWDDGWQYA